MSDCLKDVDVVVLAGGLGTRIRSVLGDTPKVLAPIGDRTYLDYLFKWLQGFGVRRVVLCLGHLSDAVQKHVEAHPVDGVEVVCVVEPAPLGTAGAIALAAQEIKSKTVMVMNGDSFTGADLCRFLSGHAYSRADGSVLCTRVPDAGRYGQVEISPDGRIESFAEKTPDAGAGAINAGLYLFEQAMLQIISDASGPSLEKDVFEKLSVGTLNAHVVDAPFIDIGTPESLAQAETVFRTP